MPSLPTVEVVYAPATEAVRSHPRDPAVLTTPFSVLKQQEGMINIYYGLQHEDQLTTYHFVVWETLEHHYRLMNDPETYPKLTGTVDTVFDTTEKPIRMIHVRPTTDPFKAFDAPVLEVATLTLQDGNSRAALEEWAEELSNALNALPASTGVVHASWGTVVEKPDAVVLFVGWTSVDAHITLNSTDASFKTFADRARALSSVEVIHIPLVLY